MNINYKYYNKQLLINQLIEQTKFNITRLTSLENIVNKLISDASVITLNKALDKAVNGYKLFANPNITEIISNTKFNYLLNINNLFNGNIFLDNEQYTKIILPNATFRNVITNITNLTPNNQGSNNNDKLIELDLSSATFDEITYCHYLFSKHSEIEYINLHNATFENVIYADRLLYECPKLKNIDLFFATFENIKRLYETFYKCPMIEIIDLPNATFNNLTWEIDNFIIDCDNLKYVNISKAKFNNKDLNSIDSFVINCKSLETVILSSATFENITMCNIFNNCPKLMIINMPNSTFKNVTNFSGSFNNCSSLHTIYITEQGFDKIKSRLPYSNRWSWENGVAKKNSQTGS